MCLLYLTIVVACGVGVGGCQTFLGKTGRYYPHPSGYVISFVDWSHFLLLFFCLYQKHFLVVLAPWSIMNLCIYDGG